MFYGGSVLEKDFVDNEKGTSKYLAALLIHRAAWFFLVVFIIIPVICIPFIAGFFWLAITFNTPGFWLAIGLVLLWELNKRVGKKRKPS